MFVQDPEIGIEATQRQLLAALLEHHPRMLTLNELHELVPDAGLEDALTGLIGDGIVTRLGEMVSVSWAG